MSRILPGDSEAFKKLVHAVAKQVGEKIRTKLEGVGSLDATNLATELNTPLKNALKAGLNTQKSALEKKLGSTNDKLGALLVAEEFGYPDASVEGGGGQVNVNAGGQANAYVTFTANDRDNEKVTVSIHGGAGNQGSAAVNVTRAKTGAQAQRIAFKLAKALTKITQVQFTDVKQSSSGSVTVQIKHGSKDPETVNTNITNGTGTITFHVDGYASLEIFNKIKEGLQAGISTGSVEGTSDITGTVTISQNKIDGDTNNSLSPLLLFPVGSFILLVPISLSNVLKSFNYLSIN